MEGALAQAGLSPADIDYINLHGTATHNNDAAEGCAVAGLFGNRVPASSTKGITGHTLGAAGRWRSASAPWPWPTACCRAAPTPAARPGHPHRLRADIPQRAPCATS
jgi:hypothetical protein